MQTTTIARASASNIVHVFLTDSGATTGAGKAGLAYNTSGLIITLMRPGASAPTIYKVADSNVEDITTIGSYQAPSASKIRFREIDATNLPGWYEIHLPDGAIPGTGIAGAQLACHVYGASGLRPETIQILVGLPLIGSGANQIAVDGSGRAAANVTAIAGSTAAASVLASVHAGLASAEVLGTPSASQFDGSTALSSSDGFYANCFVLFQNGNNAGIARKVSRYTGAARTFAFEGGGGATDRAFPAVPDAGDDFVILGLGP